MSPGATQSANLAFTLHNSDYSVYSTTNVEKVRVIIIIIKVTFEDLGSNADMYISNQSDLRG